MKKSTNITISALWLASASWSLGSVSIERVEYFVGEDPGRGLATELPIPADQSSLEAALVFPPGSLPENPRSQITVRALDSEGNWSPPAHIEATTPFRQPDPGRTLAGTRFFFPGSAPSPDGASLTVPTGKTEADAEIELPYASLPEQGHTRGWVQVEDSDGFRGPPVPFRVTAPPPDRFAGRDIAGVATWHYSILEGSEVVANGTVGLTDDLVSGFDFRDLVIGRDYSLILKPIGGSGFPFLAPATSLAIDADSEPEWWQRRDFAETESLGSGWQWSPWFGVFHPVGNWSFHAQHGWLFVIEGNSNGLFIWDGAMESFLWTSDSIYPSMYRFSDGTWIFYQKGTENPRDFVDLATGIWEQW